MDGISSLIIAKALDGLDARLRATAQNIANGNSPAYRPVRVSFEDALRAAAAQGPDAIAAVPVRSERVQGGGELRLDLEVVTATQTSGRYGALLSLLDRQMQIARTAIAGGR